jgi:hypothetical protein
MVASNRVAYLHPTSLYCTTERGRAQYRSSARYWPTNGTWQRGQGVLLLAACPPPDAGGLGLLSNGGFRAGEFAREEGVRKRPLLGTPPARQGAVWPAESGFSPMQGRAGRRRPDPRLHRIGRPGRRRIRWECAGLRNATDSHRIPDGVVRYEPGVWWGSLSCTVHLARFLPLERRPTSEALGPCQAMSAPAPVRGSLRDTFLCVAVRRQVSAY